MYPPWLGLSQGGAQPSSPPMGMERSRQTFPCGQQFTSTMEEVEMLVETLTSLIPASGRERKELYTYE